MAAELTLNNWSLGPTGNHVAIVPIGGLQRAVVKALRYARTLSTDVRAVYVEIDGTAADALRTQWPHGDRVSILSSSSPRTAHSSSRCSTTSSACSGTTRTGT